MEAIAILHERLKKIMPELELRVNEPMSQHTSFRVGGPVSLMALPGSEQELAQIIHLASEENVKPFFLGRGSNLLVSDEGADAFVIKMAGGLTKLEMENETTLYAGSGATLAQAASFAAERGLTGLEFAHGIPGTVGGGVFMNAGAYGGELSQVLLSVDYLNEDGASHRLSGDELELGYRRSIFSRRPWLILGARMRLQPGDPAAIREKMTDLAQRRRSKQPLEYPSAGSTFKRPEGHFAGGLIEQCGLKGMSIGGAQVSQKHAGFVINTGGATCRDIVQLIVFIRETVQKETGILLEPEVRLLGCTLDTYSRKESQS